MIVPVYCLDTSSILEAWRRHYPQDVFIGFWRDLQAHIDEGVIIAPEEVQRELIQKDDDVALRAEHQTKCFIPFDVVQERHVIAVLTDHDLLMKSTRRKNAADPFVIALAKARNLIVVTEEVDGSVGKPRIPDVCQAMKIEYVSVLGLMRQEGWTYE